MPRERATDRGATGREDAMRAVILDDYSGVALRMADWASLAPAVTAESMRDHIPDADELVRRLKGAEIVVAMRERTPFPRAVLERLPDLKLLVSTGSRNASIDTAAAAERGILVCGTEMLPYPTAELAWGLIHGVMRGIAREDAAMRQGKWQVGLGRGLKGKTLGLLGFGRLGSQVARVGQAFGMEAIAWSQNLTAERAAEAGATRVEKDELFRRADVISIHLVLGDRTRHLVGARELGLMKDSAVLVNTSRGPIVDERALRDALVARRIAGAALDVYDQEPLPQEHPFRSIENLLITPHIGYVTEEGYRLAYGGAVEDIRAWLDGKPIRTMNEVKSH
jgi:phosphoglycerate dehydrogenase-like enzyme